MKPMDDVAEELMKMLPELKTEDRRSVTSPENGRLGGRTPIQVDEWARLFVKNSYSKVLNGVTFYTLRHHCGRWYEYCGNYWKNLNLKDLQAELMGFLQKEKNRQGFKDRLSEQVTRDIIHNIKSSELCNLHSQKFQMPCFLPTGEDASGWMPMQNYVLNIEEAARTLGNGLSLPPDAIRDQTPELFITYGLPYSFDEKATCPRWEKYLSEVQSEDDNRKCLQMIAGLSLVPDCSYNVAFFLYGEAGTGKSVFLNVLSALIGKENICNIPLANLANRFGLAPLTEKLLNVVGDMPCMPESGRIADIEGIFKTITAGETIPVESKGVDPWDARAIARMIFATNTLPSFTDRTNGVWDRLRIIPFCHRIRGTEKQNPNLISELLEELPGIFIWALRGLAMLRKEKTFPECIGGVEIKNELRSSSDHERTFLEEHTEAAKGHWVSSNELFQEYRVWVGENNFYACGMTKFKEAVKRLYPDMYTDNSRVDGKKIHRFWNIREKTDF